MPQRLSDVLKAESDDRAVGARPQEERKVMRLGDVLALERQDAPEFNSAGVFEVPEEQRAQWRQKGRIGFFEQWSRQDKTEMIPFNPEGAIKSVALLDTVNRLKDDNYVDSEGKFERAFKDIGAGGVIEIPGGFQKRVRPEEQRQKDIDFVRNHLMRVEEERERGFDIGGRIMQGLAQLPGYMIEFLATGGAASAGKLGVRQGVEKIAGEIAEKGALKYVTRLAASMAGATARTALMPHRLTEEFADRQLNASLELTEKGIKLAEETRENPFTSALKAFGDVMIENFSEVTGETITSVGKKVVSKVIPEKLMTSMEKIFRKLKPSEPIRKLWTQAGYSNFLGEMGEERLGDFLKAVTGVEDFGADDPHSVVDRVVASIPNGEQLLVEAGVLAFPGVLGFSIGKTLDIIDSRKRVSGRIDVDLTKELDDKKIDEILGKKTEPLEVTPEPETEEAREKPPFPVKIIDNAKIVDIQAKSNIDKALQILEKSTELEGENLFESEKVTIEEANKKGEEFYFSNLFGTSVQSPAFGNEKILFDQEGFDHISQTKRETRPDVSEEDVRRRLKLLPKVLPTLRNAQVVETVKDNPDGSRTFSVLGKFKDGSVIRVIVKELNRGGKKFFSVFDVEDLSKKIRRLTLPKSPPPEAGFGVGKAPSAPSESSITPEVTPSQEPSQKAQKEVEAEKSETVEPLSDVLKEEPSSFKMLERLQERLDSIQDTEEKKALLKDSLEQLKSIRENFVRRIRPFKGGKEAEEFRQIPSIFKNKEGLPLDEIKDEINNSNFGLRFETESELIQFLKDLDEKYRSVKKEIASFETSEVRMKEKSFVLQRIKDIEAGTREGKRLKRQEIKSVQEDVIKLLEQSDLEGAAKAKFIRAIKNVNSQETMEKALPEIISRIQELSEKASKRTLRRRIIQDLKSTVALKQSGKPVGKFTPEIQEILDKFRDVLRLDKEEATQKIQNNLDRYGDSIPPEGIVIENKLLSLISRFDEMSSSELQGLHDVIKDIKAGGKAIREMLDLGRKKKIADAREKVVQVITGGKGLDESARTFGEKDADEKTPQAVAKAFINSFIGWNDLLDVISRKDKSSLPGESFVSKFGDVFNETKAERVGTQKANKELRRMVEEVYGITKEAEVLDRLREDSRPVNLGTFKNAKGQEADLVISKSQARKKYMEMLDPSLERTFNSENGMAYTEEIRNAILKLLTPKDKAFATKQLEFYQRYYDSVNEVYSEIYGVNLPLNSKYSPIRRTDIGGNPTQGFGEFIQEINYRRSVTSSSLKSRVKNVKPLAYTSDVQVLQQHVAEMERFKNWARKVRDLNDVFGHQDVKRSIKENYGSQTYQAIFNFIRDFARGGADKAGRIGWIDALRIKFTQSVLAVRPKLIFSQMTSFLAYLDKVPVRDFVEGIIDFSSDPVGRSKLLLEKSSWLRFRGENIDRDMRDAVRSEAYQAFRLKPNFLNSLMLNVELGDKSAILLGGWSVYRKALKDGKTEVEAIDLFERISNQTQQSPDLAEQSQFQRGGSFAKLFTMFESAPNQYLRREISAFRNLFAGRGDVKQHIKTIAVYHFMLPMFFQFVSDFGRFDPKEQLRAALLGSLNGLFIVGDMIEGVIRAVLGLKQYENTIPIYSQLKDVYRAIKAVDWDDIEIEDMLKAMYELSGPAGAVTGVPAKQVTDMLKSLKDIYEGEYREGIGGLLGWSEYALKREDDDGLLF